MKSYLLPATLLLCLHCTPPSLDGDDLQKIGRAAAQPMGEQTSQHPPTPAIPSGIPVPAPERKELHGVIAEIIYGRDYTYLRLKTDEKPSDTWVAIPREELAEGQHIRIVEEMRMTHFVGREAGRTFDEIVFGTRMP